MNTDFDWDPFIGRALAYVCLDLANLRSKTKLEQAEFLERFGLPRKEAARVLGTTEASLSELARQKTKRSRGKPGERSREDDR